MGWDPASVPDPQDPATFHRSQLDWSELATTPHRELLELYRALIALRHREPEFSDLRFDTLSAEWDDAAGWCALHRGGLDILVNLGREEWTRPGRAQLLLSTAAEARAGSSGTRLPADSAAIVRRSTDRSRD